MEIRLSDSDLAGMPATLRRDLLAYIEARDKEAATAKPADAGDLSRPELLALMRDISFHSRGGLLRAILHHLAHADAELCARRQLARSLPKAQRAQLGRYVAMLNRLAGKASQQGKATLCRLDRASDSFALYPATKNRLLALLNELERSGDREEPLWE